MMSQDPYEGLMVGLEIHQQLLSPAKLFCACPPGRSEELPYSFERRLRPSQSEVGRIDPAAVFEFSKGKSNVYLWSPETSCLVDADEEPPHPMTAEALDAALLVADMLGSNAVDEVHVMRKIVIDGSNTGGFQRTAVVALGGFLQVDKMSVGIQSVTLEEDAARILGEDERSRRFALDRLGVPLVEVALDPVRGGPELVGKVALFLGRALRSTGKVARGLGTIRQDLNVSFKEGRVVEVKGVQKLNLLPKVVDYEARRQSGLVMVAEKLRERGVNTVECSVHDVTEILEGSRSQLLMRQIGAGGKVHCIVASGLEGVIGWEPFPGIRLGKEAAEIARANGLGGIIHSDEFRMQGISEAEEKDLRDKLHAQPKDGLILIAGSLDLVDRAAGPLIARFEAAIEGVPAETRGATDEGETRYMRPRPGSQRMYPETDIPDISIDRARLRRLSASLLEGWEDRVRRLAKEYSLSQELALKVYDSDAANDFESLSRTLHLEPSLVASVLVDIPARLAREGVPGEALSVEVLAEVLHAVDSGRVAKEAIPDILRVVGEKGMAVLQTIDALGLKAADEIEVMKVVDSVVSRGYKLIEARGEAAFSELMGEAMKQLRGRADGALVGKIMRERLKTALHRDENTATEAQGQQFDE
ncbi:MAG: Glu-tRNA(Gln) amidotransferase subunit GatE [Thaumarchaeota archaeon]|nr:Glu-tRNA(Gln) amidotransferase subunit GatE [Nitrososphaerota archaeon]